MQWIYNLPKLEDSRVRAMMEYARHIGIDAVELKPDTPWNGLNPAFVFGTKNLVEQANDFFPGSAMVMHEIMHRMSLSAVFGDENVLNGDSVLSKGHQIKWPENGDGLFIMPVDAGGKNRPMTPFAFKQAYALKMTKRFKTASLKNIHAEYRFFIVNQKIVTYSQYAKGGEMIISPIVPQEAQEWLEVRLPNTNGYFVVDVADTPEGFKAIEINTLNMSGLYDCDIIKLVNALKEYHEEETT